MLINELSKKTGISIHTIRFYEKSGLIKGQQDATIKSNNYFHYDDEAVYKLELIRDAKSIGFTLSEIKHLIEAWYDKKFSVAQKLDILDQKLVAIDEKIKQLKDMKKLHTEFKKEIAEHDC